MLDATFERPADGPELYDVVIADVAPTSLPLEGKRGWLLTSEAEGIVTPESMLISS